MLAGILHKGEPDEDFDWRDQYKIETFAIRGLKQEVLLESVIDFDRMAADNKHLKLEHLREQVYDMQRLGFSTRVRLLPATG